jgi:Amt family ammonium transporter
MDANLQDNSGEHQHDLLMESVLACIPEAIAILRDGRVVYTNPAFTRIFGFTAEEVDGADLGELIVPETRRQEIDILEKSIAATGFAALDTVRLHKQGGLIDVSLVAAPLRTNEANSGVVLTYRDIRERKQVEAKLQHDALHDLLTGLPNRALFLDRLTHALSRRGRHREQTCGLLFVDLDRFKEVNDSLGHAAGDVLLSSVAKRLANAIRPQDTAARLGGDEFALLLENIVTVDDLELVATRVVREFERPFDVFFPFPSGQRQRRSSHGRSRPHRSRTALARCRLCHVPRQAGRRQPLRGL